MANREVSSLACALAREESPQHDLHGAGECSGGRAMVLKTNTEVVGDSLLYGKVI